MFIDLFSDFFIAVGGGVVAITATGLSRRYERANLRRAKYEEVADLLGQSRAWVPWLLAHYSAAGTPQAGSHRPGGEPQTTAFLAPERLLHIQDDHTHAPHVWRACTLCGLYFPAVYGAVASHAESCTELGKFLTKDAEPGSRERLFARALENDREGLGNAISQVHETLMRAEKVLADNAKRYARL